MKIVAIIPARAGSRSIKNKNLIQIKNKPLIYYSINSAKKSNLINRIIVSTDSKKIKEVAKSYGAEVPFLRPKKISGFLSRDIKYLKHCINWLKKENYIPDLIVLLRPTTPFRETKIIDKAIKLVIKNKSDSLRSVSVAKETPYKMWKKKENLCYPFLDLKKLIKPIIQDKNLINFIGRMDMWILLNHQQLKNIKMN